jgi:hypothetical protein
MLGLDISPIAPTIFFSFYYWREIWWLYQAEKRLSVDVSLFKIWLRYALSPGIIRGAAISSVKSSGMMMGLEIV